MSLSQGHSYIDANMQERTHILPVIIFHGQRFPAHRDMKYQRHTDFY